MGGDIHDEGVGTLLVGERSARTRYRLSAPSRTAPTRIGNANSARAVASRTGPVNETWQRRFGRISCVPSSTRAQDA